MRNLNGGWKVCAVTGNDGPVIAFNEFAVPTLSGSDNLLKVESGP